MSALVLVGVLWFLVGLPGPARAAPMHGERVAARPATELRDCGDPGADLVPASLAPGRRPSGDPDQIAVAPPAPASLSGLLTIDDVVPEGGQLVLRAEDGQWEARSGLDRFGRFFFADLPIAPLGLAFEPAPVSPGSAAPPGTGEQRRLLSPELRVLPEPGREQHVELEWSTKHINLRVVGDAPEGNRSLVEVEGPAVHASFETDDSGKARLGIVGDGRFLFRAVQPSGRRGEAELELDEEVDLETVVIAATVPEQG